jgi:hypothetical protein
MSQVALEAFLARLYTDAEARSSFLADPGNAARDAGLDRAEVDAMCATDIVGLQMAATSYAHKREQHRSPKKKAFDLLWSWWRR